MEPKQTSVFPVPLSQDKFGCVYPKPCSQHDEYTQMDNIQLQATRGMTDRAS